MRHLATLTLVLLGLLAVAPGRVPPAAMPGPVETFNLWSHFIAIGETDGAIALVHRPAVTDRAALAKRIGTFVDRAAAHEHRPIAVGVDREEDIALVHFYDGRLSSGRLDIDPAFLVHDGQAWTMLPIFGRPRMPLPYLSEAQNGRLSRRLAAYMRVSSKLPEEYAPLVEETAGDDTDAP